MGTPRRVIDDLEDSKQEEDAPDSERKFKKLTKSVTFDMRKFEEKQPTVSEDGNGSQDDDMPDEFKDEDRADQEYFAQENIIQSKEKPVWKKILLHMKHSSLFIFHRDWRFRKLLINLVVSPEARNEYNNKKIEDAPFTSAQQEQMDEEMEHDRVNQTMKYKDSMKISGKEKSVRKLKSMKKRDDLFINTSPAKTELKTIRVTAKKKKK